MNQRRTVLVFSPQGGQWPSMGKALLAEEPSFRRAVEACDEALRPLRNQSVIEALGADRGSDSWRRADFVQPLIFVIQVALARLWQSRGVLPDAVVGHSVGEIAAAHIAGALTLQEAALTVHHYSRLQQETVADTGMATVELSAAAVEGLLSNHPGLVIAGENSGTSTLVSGDAGAIAALVEHVRKSGSFAARIDVGVAAHSPHIDPILATLRSCLRDLRPAAPKVPFVSSALGALLDGRPLDGNYFAEQLRAPVRFRQAMSAVLSAGPATLLEIGPHPVLGDAMRAASGASESEVLAAMRRDAEPPRSLLDAARAQNGRVESRAATRATGTAMVAIAAALGRAPHELPDDVPLMQLGLDSLAAARLADLLVPELGVRLPLARLAAASARQLEAIAAELLESDGGPISAVRPSSAQVAPGDAFPLNEIQQAYFVGRQGLLEWGNVPTHLYLELDGELDPARLRRAWRRVLERHDALRLVFTPDGMQRVLAEAPAYELPVVDLRSISPADRDAAMAAVAKWMSDSVPDLYGWPHFQLCLHLVDGAKTRLHASFDMLVADLHAIGVLFRDWQAFYADDEAALPPINLRLPAYAAAERSMRASKDATAAAEAYWEARLGSLPPAPPLPEGPVRPPPRPTFEHRMARLPAPAWRALQRRARREGLSPSSLLCAAYAEVLAYFSAPRFTLTLPCFRRLPVHAEAQDLVGDFTSTVLLAVDGGAHDSFLERARALTRQLWSDLDHLVVSGIRVISRLQRERREPVSFPVIFTSGLSDLAPQMRWAGALRSMASQTAQVRLDCIVHEHDGELLVCWDSAAEHFPPGLVERMFEVFRGLIERLADASERPWDAEPLRPVVAEEWARAAVFNATARDLPRALLHDRARAQAVQQPEAVAVIAGDTVLRHRDLDGFAAAIAERVRAERAGRDTLVAIVMEPGWEQVAAAHGVSRSGAAYLPIDADLPIRRIQELLADAGAAVVLTQARVDERIAWQEAVRRIRVDELSPESARAPGNGASAHPHHLAYVIYTSGSAGRPKGVMIEHAAAANTCHDINARFSVGPGDRVLALSAMSFDLSVYDIFGVLGAGGAMVYAEPSAQRDPARWIELMEAHGVTIWNTAPALMTMLADFAIARGDVRFPHLRLVLLSGDWIPTDLPAKIRALAPNAQIVSLGGATEASIWSIAHPIDRVDPTWPSIPYGRPLANQRFYVLDSRIRPCPVSVTGELYIGGVGLARGYWKSRELTAAKFIVHPETGERLYRTGDLGRWMPEGWIQFQGRVDRQIKLRGHRIELGEIDAALAQHPGVRAACSLICGTGATDAGRFIAAYVVPADERALDEEELRAHLAERLPSYMVPTRIVTVAEIPLTANGKIDAGRLPAPIRASSAAGDVRASAEEEWLAGVWAKLLGTTADSIAPDDHFFDLGGNSLLLVRLHAELREARGVVLPLIALMEHSTVRAMARLIAAPAAANASDAAARGRERARRQAARRRVA